MLMKSFNVSDDYHVRGEILGQKHYNAGLRLAIEFVARNTVDEPANLIAKFETICLLSEELTIGLYDKVVDVEKIATITLVPESEKEAEIFKNIKGVLITTENEQFVYIYIFTDKAVADVVADETDNKFRSSGLKTKERS